MQNSNQLALACAPQSMEQLWKFAQMASKTALVPQGFRGKPEDCYIAIQMGLELGLKPLQALSGIAVVNGKACLYGDSLIALVRSFPECEYVVESFDEQTMTATCKSKRKGQPEQATNFSKADAQTAKLWGKQGPWTQYPKRMLQMRARGFNLRDVFPDALMGIITMEEAKDYPVKEVKVTEVTNQPEPPKLERTIEEAREALKLKLEGGGYAYDVDAIHRAESEAELKVIWNSCSSKASEKERAQFWAFVEEEGLSDYLTDESREAAKKSSPDALTDMINEARDMKALDDRADAGMGADDE